MENKTPWDLRVQTPNAAMLLQHVLQLGSQWLALLGRASDAARWADKPVNGCLPGSVGHVSAEAVPDHRETIEPLQRFLASVKISIGYCLSSAAAQKLQSVAESAAANTNNLENERVRLCAGNGGPQPAMHLFLSRLHDYALEFGRMTAHLEAAGPCLATQIVADQWAQTAGEDKLGGCYHMPSNVHANGTSAFGSQSVVLKQPADLQPDELDALCRNQDDWYWEGRPISFWEWSPGEQRAAVAERVAGHTHRGRCAFRCTDLVAKSSCTLNLVWEVET